MRIIKVQFEVSSKELPTEYFDVGLRCQDNNEVIRGHKVFLAAVSPRLEELFDEHGEGDEAIVIRNIRFEVLSYIIRFVYTGKIDVRDQTPEFVEDFRDGMNMLRITLCDKAEKKITVELKELKKLFQLRRLKEVKEKELTEMRAMLAKSDCITPGKRCNSDDNHELNNNRTKGDSSNGSLRGGVEKKNRGGNILEEGELEHSGSDEKDTAAGEMTLENSCETPTYDLRGLLINKQIKRIRRSVERGQGAVWKSGGNQVTEEGHWGVEPKFNEDMYAFDPNDPVANPDWSPDLQVMIGPLPNHLTYKEVELAVWKIGDIQRLYLQWNNKFKPRPFEANEVRFAYVVFKELAAAKRLLEKDQRIEISRTFYGTTRMRVDTHQALH